VRTGEWERHKFKRKLDEAVAAMLTQRNVEEAARSVGVSTATLMRWQRLPEFQIAYRERAGPHTASRRASPAAATLLKTMIDPNAPASVATGGRGNLQSRGQSH